MSGMHGMQTLQDRATVRSAARIGYRNPGEVSASLSGMSGMHGMQTLQDRASARSAARIGYRNPGEVSERVATCVARVRPADRHVHRQQRRSPPLSIGGYFSVPPSDLIAASASLRKHAFALRSPIPSRPPRPR